MSVVCVAWSSHVGALMSAASRPGMPSVRVLSSRMLEEPDGVERCLETMRSATALFVFRTTDALWDQLDEGIRLIGKTVPVVCVSYDPAAWALSSVPVETATNGLSLSDLWRRGESRQSVPFSGRIAECRGGSGTGSRSLGRALASRCAGPRLCHGAGLSGVVCGVCV